MAVPRVRLALMVSFAATALFIVTAVVVPSAKVMVPVPGVAPSVYAAALIVSNVMFERKIVPTVIVVLPLPALSNVAVSPTPGTGDADQFVVVDQSALVVPFHVADAACADGPDASTTKATSVVTAMDVRRFLFIG